MPLCLDHLEDRDDTATAFRQWRSVGRHDEEEAPLMRASDRTIPDAVLAAVVLGLGALWAALWLAASLSSALSGHGWLAPRAVPPVAAFGVPGNPSQVWGSEVGSPL